MIKEANFYNYESSYCCPSSYWFMFDDGSIAARVYFLAGDTIKRSSIEASVDLEFSIEDYVA